MRSALVATDADLIAFVDADVTNFGPHFVTDLLEPLLVDDTVTLVKGYYRAAAPRLARTAVAG